ncbi:unnamed protein product [Parascedosporium putredinis]|uniref:Extracellular serine-rich protein n=1 Tax=Parascedosporium putredinis TaxID=1442378 RepID=A0A9P1MCN3_9PEZI|nr:unnamed protein product [Parascedosporium putredinis]CAI8001001.1 unnamed protein product [Parascedosporium putredinis]
MFSKIVTILATAAALGSAAPTKTTADIASRTEFTGVTHTVAVGRAGLNFEPNNIFAKVGDLVEFHYLPANHSVVQASFEKPCVPQDEDSFFSGFFPVSQGQSDEVFQIVVEDTKPIWFYCSQGDHCSKGMVGSINQNVNSPKTLSAFRELATNAGPGVSQPYIQGGCRIPNPQPNAGI